jgi:hypothetical protein
MLAPLNRIISEADLLPDIRFLLNWRPELADHPERLAALLRVDECEILACLEALRDERGEVLA